MPSPRPSLPRRAFQALIVVAAVALAGGRGRCCEPPPADDGPVFTADGRLVRPEAYREWVYVTSGLGMTYGPAQDAEGREPRFDNVFVARDAYRAFLETGTWPPRTMLVLEVRAAEANVSINNGGRTQGRLLALEAAVKDAGRFPEEGWGYFSFDGPDGPVDAAPALPATASCYSCHREKAAVDNTFVQFYPTLLDVATRLGTIRPEHTPVPHP